MEGDIQEVLQSQEAIANRVKELGREISQRFAGKEVVVIGVLKGSFMFVADLVREIKVDHTVDFLSVSSYGNKSVSVPGSVRILLDMKSDVFDKHVIIAEDIIDSGYTMQFLQNLIKSRGAASVTSCILLRKQARIKVNCLTDDDLIGFDIPDEFVVGYGMDYAERYRSLPFIGILKREVYAKE